MGYSLAEKISSDFWIGKEILKISSTLLSIIKAPSDSIKSLPPFQAIADLPPLAFINDQLNQLPELIPSCCYYLLESGYSINKAYNSTQYAGRLSQRGKQLFNSYVMDGTNTSLYLATIKGQNTFAGVYNHFSEAWNNLEAWSEQPSIWIENTKNEWLLKMADTIRELETQIANATDDVLKKLKRKLRDVKRCIKRMTGQKSLMVARPRFVAPIVPVQPGTPSVIGAAQVIQEIAKFFLDVLCQGTFAVPVEALTWTASSVVMKCLGADGADACRYMAGGIFRTAGEIPKLVSPTGLFAGCWMAIQAYAPYILLAAVITVLLIRANQTIGEYLYVFGTNGSAVAYVTAKLFDTNWEEMNRVLTRLGDLSDVTTRKFENLTGFAFNSKDEIVMCLDLTQNPPEPIYGKSAQQLRFEPFRPLYEHGPLAL